MLNEEIKSLVEDKMVLSEGDDGMGAIWQKHAEAHKEAFHAAGRLHTFLSSRIHNHGLTHEYLSADPKAHEKVFDAIHKSGISMTKGERKELGDHVNALKDAQAKREAAVEEHDDHPRFKASVGRAIIHGAFGKAGTSLSGKLNSKKDDSLTDMEHHSTLAMMDPSNRKAHALRRKHGADYAVSDPSPISGKKKQQQADDDEPEGFMQHAARRVGGAIKTAVLDTLRNPNNKGMRRRK